MSTTATRSPPVVLVGLDTLPGLQTARLLARHRLPVFAIASDPKHHNCRTRVCKEIRYADCRSDEFIATLQALAKTLGERAVLVPCIDPAVLAISGNRAVLESDYVIPLCDDRWVQLLTHKVSFYRYAAEHHLPIPKTMFLDDKQAAFRAAEEFVFPAVLKPSIRLAAWEAKTALKAIRVDSATELLRRYDECRSWTDLLILQEWIEGGDDALISFNGYFNARSEALATFIARKIRQWPPHVGFSCLGQEYRDDFVLEESIKLFELVGYHGLAYVEFKRDSRSGKRYMIEANIGRPTGRSAIAEAGRVELLYTMYCDAVGLPLPEARVQKYLGAKWIDLRHDLMSALYYWRKGELSIADWWRSIRGKKAYAYFSWKDPMPFLFDLVRMAKPSTWTRRKAPLPSGSLKDSRDSTPPA